MAMTTKELDEFTTWLMELTDVDTISLMFTPGSKVRRKSDGKGGKLGLVLFFDRDKKKYAIKWPKRRRYVAVTDLVEVAHQATLFEGVGQHA